MSLQLYRPNHAGASAPFSQIQGVQVCGRIRIGRCQRNPPKGAGETASRKPMEARLAQVASAQNRDRMRKGARTPAMDTLRGCESRSYLRSDSNAGTAIWM